MSEEIKHDIGLTKTIAKKAIEAIGQYLVDNAERIAGESDYMVEFELNAKFHTKTDEPGAGCPEISIRNQHYIPLAEELQEMIFKACFDEEKFTRTNYMTTNEVRQAMGLKVENDPRAEMLIKKDEE